MLVLSNSVYGPFVVFSFFEYFHFKSLFLSPVWFSCGNPLICQSCGNPLNSQFSVTLIIVNGFHRIFVENLGYDYIILYHIIIYLYLWSVTLKVLLYFFATNLTSSKRFDHLAYVSRSPLPSATVHIVL